MIHQLRCSVLATLTEIYRLLVQLMEDTVCGHPGCRVTPIAVEEFKREAVFVIIPVQKSVEETVPF